MTSSVVDVAQDLSGLLGQTISTLESISEEDSLKTRGPGTWSRKQILGHLIDSALNNVHRFIRAQQADELTFPDYDQPAWVAAGGYQDRPWTDLVTLWAVLNVHLVHVMARVPAPALETSCRIGEDQPLTLDFIVRDYMRHLRHHLEQIFNPRGSRARTPPPPE